MEQQVPETATAPLFVALASVLAAIESGAIADGEVEESASGPDGDRALTIRVSKTIRPLIGSKDD